MKQWDIYSFGDLNLDLLIPELRRIPPDGQERFIPELYSDVGGGAALFALGAARLGLRVLLDSRVGDDFYGDYLLERCRSGGLDGTLLKKVKGASSGISLSFTQSHERSFITYAGTNQRLAVEELSFEQACASRHVHLTGYHSAHNHARYLSMLREIKARTNASVSMDIGWDESGVWSSAIEELFPYLDIMFMNEAEALHFGRRETVSEVAEAYGKHLPFFVVKCGSNGSLAAHNGELLRAAAFWQQSVDTTGAGDSFNAGFVSAYLRGYGAQDALRVANACGALSVRAYGGNKAFPSSEELTAFLEDRLGYRLWQPLTHAGSVDAREENI